MPKKKIAKDKSSAKLIVAIIGGLIIVGIIASIIFVYLFDESPVALSEEEYLEFMDRENPKSLALLEEFTNDNPKDIINNEAYLANLRNYRDRFYSLKKDWDAVMPPAKFKAYHGHNSAWLGHMGDSINLLSQAIEKISPELFDDFEEMFDLAIRDLEKSVAELKRLDELEKEGIMNEAMKLVLEEQGYEVISNYYAEDEVGTYAYLEMKLAKDTGDPSMRAIDNYKSDQALKGIIALAVAYPYADDYIVTLVTPTDECFYIIDGLIYRGWTANPDDNDLFNRIVTELNIASINCN